MSWVLRLGLAIAVMQLMPSVAAKSHGICSPPLFVFGASLMDVGQNAAAMPFHSYSEFPPYGMDFFGKPGNRFSNGRLFVDFISEAFGQDYCRPYLQAHGGSFRQGVSFASSGATAINSTLSGTVIFNGLFDYVSNGLFSLLVQIDQFRQFKSSVMRANEAGWQPQFRDDGFSSAIYIIEIANNDYLNYAFKTTDFVASDLVARVLDTMEQSFKILYSEGARKVVVFNLVPLGCTPVVAARSGALDASGCENKYNEISELHNVELEALIERVNMQLPQPAFFIFDKHQIFMNAINNPAAYGLKHVLTSCCGYGGGLYNHRDEVHCGGFGYIDGVLTGFTVCDDPSSFLFWDSFHPTEAFNQHIADAFLRGKHVKPYFVLQESCSQSEK